MSLMRFITLLWKYIVPYRGLAIVLVAGLLFEASFTVGLQYSLKYLIDTALAPQDGRQLAVVLGLLAGGAVLFTAGSVACDYLWAQAGVRITNELKRDLYNHLQSHGGGLLSQKPIGDLMNRFLSDAALVKNGLVIALPAGLLGMGGLVLAAALLVHLEWRLALLCFAGLIGCFVAPRRLERLAAAASYRLREWDGRVAASIQETLSAQATVKAFGLEAEMSRRFACQLESLLQTAVRANFLGFLVQRAPNLGFLLLHLTILGVGAWLTFQGEMTLSGLVTGQVLLVGIQQAVNNLTWVFPALLDACAGLQRIVEVLQEPSAIQDAAQPQAVSSGSKGLAFENITFGYPDRCLLLHGMNFAIPQGSFVALVGPSGAGKSTILRLLSRFHDPAGGRVTMDGVDVRALAHADLLCRMGTVFQEVVLFRGTLRDNIRMGLLSASQEQIEAAARAADIHEAILAMPQGYDTCVGAGGIQLSGGERQRLGLARALVRDPHILLLDEPTSALDPATEAAVVATLRRVARGRTVIAVTHRPALAAVADTILVVAQGTIAEQGTHDELLRTCGFYRALWHQAKAKTLIETGLACA